MFVPPLDVVSTAGAAPAVGAADAAAAGDAEAAAGVGDGCADASVSSV